jgi:hypothetical protein
MPYIRFPLRTVSPTLIRGAYSEKDDIAEEKLPILRASSIIGQLRFWLRAMLGTYITDTEQIYRVESSLLGSTKVASSVTIKVDWNADDKNFEKFRVLPHSSQPNKQFEKIGFKPRYPFDLVLLSRPGTTINPNLIAAILVWTFWVALEIALDGCLAVFSCVVYQNMKSHLSIFTMS